MKKRTQGGHSPKHSGLSLTSVYIIFQLAKAQEELKWTNARVGKELGMTGENWGHILSGRRRFDLGLLERIANLFRRDVAWFLPPVDGEEPSGVRSPSVVLSELQTVVGDYIPCYDTLRRDALPVAYVRVGAEMPVGTCVAYCVTGLELPPQICEGDCLVVDTAADIRPGDAVVCQRDGQPCIGICASESGLLVLSNESGHWGMADCQVRGVVVELRRRIRQ